MNVFISSGIILLRLRISMIKVLGIQSLGIVFIFYYKAELKQEMF